MAYCPECGGSVAPTDFLASHPGPVRCRWCNARVALPLWGRLLRDTLIVVLGTLVVCLAGVRFEASGDILWLLLGSGGLLLACALGILLELFLPLYTVVPRGVAPWRRCRPPSDPNSDLGPDAPVAKPYPPEESA